MNIVVAQSVFLASAKRGATFQLGIEKFVILTMFSIIIREISCYLGMAWAVLDFSECGLSTGVCCWQ